MKTKSHLVGCSAALGMAIVLTGCQTYQQQNKALVHYREGRLDMAEAAVTARTKANGNNKDTLIWQLERGTILRAEQKFEESNKAFATAVDRVEYYESGPGVSISKEGAALMSNQANLPYRGRTYDKIMLAVYRALNFMMMGDLEKALVELNAAEKFQGDAVEANKDRIAKTQEDLENAKNKDKIRETQEHEDTKTRLGQTYGDLDQLETYGDYVNPFAAYLHGIFRLATGDAERSRQLLKTVAACAKGNPFVAQDLENAEAAADGRPLAPVTYVVFETGCAPERKQVRIDIPIVVARLSYVGAAFPKLEMNADFVDHLRISTCTSNIYETALVASMDNVVGHEFKNELPIIITKTIASTVAKAVADYAANTAAANSGNDWVALFVKVGTIAAQAAMNIADTRTWTTLPKQFQVARIPTPPDRCLHLQSPTGVQSATVTVGEGTVNLVYVKSINQTAPFLVSLAKLK